MKIQTSGDGSRDIQLQDSFVDSTNAVPTSRAIQDFVGRTYIARIINGNTTALIVLNTTGATCTVTKIGSQFSFTFDRPIFASPAKYSIATTPIGAGDGETFDVVNFGSVANNNQVIGQGFRYDLSGDTASASGVVSFEIQITIF